MPTTITEKWDSRERTTLEDESAELRYIVRGTEDDSEVASLVQSTSPTTYAGLPRRSITFRTLETSTIWECTVSYAKKDPATENSQENPPETGDMAISFDTAGGMQHISQSLQTVQKKSFSEGQFTPPDFKGAIGVTKDSVEGVEIYVPSFQYQVTRYVAIEQVTQAYINNLFRLTGKTNRGNFHGFAAGQVLLAGVSGSQRGEADWELTYKFLCSENRSNLTIGEITGVNKKGWEYLWVIYEDSEDETAKWLVKKPVAAYVEKVYEDGDFGLLGL